jgi:hypothetical protein
MEAWKLLSMNVLPYFQIVTLTPEMYRETIQECADRGWIGGRTYDALHLCCAKKAACDRIYTFNVRHFQQLGPDLADRIGAPEGFLIADRIPRRLLILRRALVCLLSNEDEEKKCRGPESNWLRPVFQGGVAPLN